MRRMQADPGDDEFADDPLDADETGDDKLVVPQLSRSPSDLVAWIRWIGPARLLTGAGGLVVAGAVGWWMLRPPATPTEALLPRATTTVLATPESATADATTAASTVATPGTVVVHVTGEVNVPGLVVLDDGARVADAIAAGGGPTGAADADLLNLAAPVHDGERIDVPAVGDTVALVAAPPPQSGSVAPSGPVDLNSATAAELETLPGVGPTTSAAIIEHRERNGPFAAVDELDDVSGIGPAKLEQLRPLVTV